MLFSMPGCLMFEGDVMVCQSMCKSWAFFLEWQTTLSKPCLLNSNFGEEMDPLMQVYNFICQGHKMIWVNNHI
ncbi:hypothetical protein SLEP1_g48547 [Rubroshorea leprosula]|uniref:Uncharacterized protein n=1 Tax=Rubroshorea leprosula TaxID=152421 RepID=A0AAV5LWZ7_9ROSI|nr:hypothetical protein SLEP1_g48547 [Rubroshorea leprosula]